MVPTPSTAAAKAFGMRSAPKNLSLEDFEEGSRYAHERGARVYVTCNVLPRNNEIEAMRESRRPAQRHRRGRADLSPILA